VDAGGAADERAGSRTAKSWRPDTPTLVSSWRGFPQATEATSRLSGETSKETVKTIARGMPDLSGVTVVDLLGVLFSFAPEAAGATGVRHSLRPLIFRRRNDLGKTRACRAARMLTYTLSAV
jgi:hypothetical protein